MGKSILVVSKRRDILKEDIGKVMQIFNDRVAYVKKKYTAKSFQAFDLTPERMGLLWFCSSDYTKFIENEQFFKDYAQGYIKFIFEFTLNDVSDENINKTIEHIRHISTSFSLPKINMYIKLDLKNCHDEDTLYSVFEKLSVVSDLIYRIQCDFSSVKEGEIRQIGIASTLTSLASKFNILVSSCTSHLFNKANKWIRCEPCISGRIMTEIIGMKMVTVRHLAPTSEDCMCHKYVDILGTGEEFNGDKSLVRDSDKKVELKKIISFKDQESASVKKHLQSVERKAVKESLKKEKYQKALESKLDINPTSKDTTDTIKLKKIIPLKDKICLSENPSKEVLNNI